MAISPLTLVACIAVVFLSLFLLVKHRSFAVIPLIILLLLVLALQLWESYILLHPQQLFLTHGPTRLEGFLPLAAFFYSVHFCRPPGIANLSRASRAFLFLAFGFALGSLWLPPESLFYSPDFGAETLLFLTNSGFLFFLLLSGFLVLSMVHLERTLSALSQQERWRVKFEIIATCVLLGAHVIYYSQALLYRSLDMSLLDTRSFALVIAVGLLFYSRIYRNQGAEIRISPGVAYRSCILFALSIYVIGLGLIGEGMTYLVFPAQRIVMLAVAMVSTVLVSLLFLSENFHRRIKVTLHKNFYPSKYDYRVQWRAFTERISTTTSLAALQQAILVFFCETFGSKGAALYQFQPEEQVFKSVAHFQFRRDWRSLPVTDPSIVDLASKDWCINLDEVQKEGRLFFETMASSKASLIIPLLFDNELAGFIVLAERISQKERLSYEDYDLMRMLARQSIATLQGITLAEQLTTARELAAIGKVSTFVLHDLKNQVSGLSLMLDNARSYIEDPEFQQDMLETIQNTMNNMKGLIAKLKNLKEKPQLVTKPVNLQKILKDAAVTCGGKVNLNGDAIFIDADEEEIYKVVLNLFVNAREASPESAAVRVDFWQEEGWALVRVSDQGCGMSADFIATRLFQPFATTKKYGFGIGLYQCRQIMDAHGGQIEVISQPGEGSSFTLHLPLAPELSNN